MQAMKVMSALAQPIRLQVWRTLVDRLPDGMTAGDIARAVDMSKNGMSPHFAILSAAGLLSAEKVGRMVIYRAETVQVEDLSAFLSDACERGRDAGAAAAPD